jgi:hypothetical protein
MYSDNHFKMTNRCVKELVDFIKVFQILPRHVSASGCHLQGGHKCLISYSSSVCCGCIRVMIHPVWPVVSMTTGHTGRIISHSSSVCVMGYDPISVVSCVHDNWPHWMDYKLLKQCLCCGRIQVTIFQVWSVVSTTTGHTERIITTIQTLLE